MEITCKTCKHFRNNECEHPELSVDKEFFEGWLMDVFDELRRRSEKKYIREVLEIVEEATLDEIKPKNFVPPDDDFVCRYYE